VKPTNGNGLNAANVQPVKTISNHARYFIARCARFVWRSIRFGSIGTAMWLDRRQRREQKRQGGCDA